MMKGSANFFILLLFFVVFGAIIYMVYISYNTDNQSQGVRGVTMVSPSICIPDDRNPDECVTRVTPGTANVKVYAVDATQPYQPKGKPVKNFESRIDGSFFTGLAPGQYCLIGNDGPCNAIEIKEREWLQKDIEVEGR